MHTKSLNVIALLLAATASSVPAADYHLNLDPDSTRIHWVLGDVLHTVHGTFRLRSGEIAFDNNTGKASGMVIVDAVSGESGSSARDGRMHKNVLESAKYPEATFAPDHIEGTVTLTGTSHVKLHGTFTIHGSSHEIVVPVQVTAGGDKLGAKLKFEVPFVAWGMKDPSTLLLRVSKLVEVEMESTGHVTPALGTASQSH